MRDGDGGTFARGAGVRENIKIGVMLPFSGVNADLGDVQTRRSTSS